MVEGRVFAKFLVGSGLIALCATLVVGWLSFANQPKSVFEAIEPMYLPMLNAPTSVRLFPMVNGKREGSGKTASAMWAARALHILESNGDRNPPPPPFAVEWNAVAVMTAEGQQACLFVGYGQSAVALGFGPSCKPADVAFSRPAAVAFKSLFDEGLPSR